MKLRDALAADETREFLRGVVRDEMRAEVDRRVEEALSRPSTVAKVARSGRPDMAVLDGAGAEALASSAEKRLDTRVEETRRALAGPGETAADHAAAERRLTAQCEAIRAASGSERRRVSRVGAGVLESLSGDYKPVEDAAEEALSVLDGVEMKDQGATPSGVTPPVPADTVRLERSGRVVESAFAVRCGGSAWAQRARLAGLSPATLEALGGSAA